MIGQWMRLNRLFRGGQRAVLVALDECLLGEPGRGPIVSPEVIAELAEADGIILTSGMLRRCAHGFDYRGAPLAVVRIDCAALPQTEGYRAPSTAAVVEPAAAQAMGADMVLMSLAMTRTDAEADAGAVAAVARAVSEKLRCGVPLIGEVRPPHAGSMLADALFAQTDAGCRLMSELGADAVISIFTGERFAETAAACSVPLLAMPQTAAATKLDVLHFAYQAVKAGARGVRVGREVTGTANPAALLRALQAVVKDEKDPDAAAAEHGVR